VEYAECVFSLITRLLLRCARYQILEMRSHSGGILAREALVHYKRAVELGVEGDGRYVALSIGSMCAVNYDRC
jgi:hypothetical protein